MLRWVAGRLGKVASLLVGLLLTAEQLFVLDSGAQQGPESFGRLDGPIKLQCGHSPGRYGAACTQWRFLLEANGGVASS